MLGVPHTLLEEKGAVSAEVAEAMAVGCRTRLRTDLAVSTVGVAGPGDAGPDKPVGLVYRRPGLGGRCDVAYRSAGLGTRAEVQRRTAKLALNRVRLHLLEQE